MLFMTTRKTLLLCALCAALSSHGAITVSDVENALINDGAPASVKYLDLQPTTFTNGSLSLSTNLSSGDWGYPDGSNSNLFVGAGLLDDKGESTPEISATISGLAANTDYDLWITMKWTDNERKNEDLFDFSWGTTSGSLSTVTPTTSSGDPVPGTLVAQDDPTDPSFSNNLAYQFATLSSDASGEITLYLNNGEEFVEQSGDANLYRSQIDGLAIAAVPEPAHAVALLGLAGLGLVLYRRRRS